MTWEYTLINLIIGFIIGALVIRFSKTKLSNQQALQTKLKKKNNELKKYHKELVNHFESNAKLLDNMAQDYRQLFQHIVKNYHELIPDITIQQKSFNYHLTESTLENDEATINLPPKDYFEGSSGLFGTTIKENK